MPSIKRAKIVWEQDGVVRTMTKRYPVFLPVHQNSELLGIEVRHRFGKQTVYKSREDVVTFPRGELARPSIVLACAKWVAKEQTEKLEDANKKVKYLEGRLIATETERDNALAELKKLRAEMSLEINTRIKEILDKVAEFQKAQRPKITAGKI